MYKHHIAAIETLTNKLKVRDEVLGVIIGGSIAHGFASEDSDRLCTTASTASTIGILLTGTGVNSL